MCGTAESGSACVHGNDTPDATTVDPSRTSNAVAYGGVPDTDTTMSSPLRAADTPVGAAGVVYTVAMFDQADWPADAFPATRYSYL